MKFSDIDVVCEGRNLNNQSALQLVKSLTIPKTVILEKVSFHLSSPIFFPLRKECFFVCAVEHNGTYRLRTFFLSRSQAVWRMLKGYKFTIDDTGNEKPVWNDKGFGEESLLLPLELQEILFNVAKQEPIHHDKHLEIFYGSAPKSGVEGWYEDYISTAGEKLSFVNYETDNPEDVADLGSTELLQTLSGWKNHSGFYGEVTYTVVELESTYKILVINDAEDRYFIGGFELINSPVTPIGLRETWIAAGHLLMPLLEYKTEKVDQTLGYGNEDCRSGPYVGMHKHFLSKIHFIQKVRRHIEEGRS